MLVWAPVKELYIIKLDVELDIKEHLVNQAHKSKNI